MTPDERVGLRQAIANDPGNMSWPSKTVSELLDDLDISDRQRTYAFDANRELLNSLARQDTEVARLRQEIVDARGEATAEAVRADVTEAQRDHARDIARMFINYTGVPCANWLVGRHASLDALPDWLTAEPETNDD